MMTSYNLPLNIIIAGVGGQGNILASRLIALTAVKKGHFAIIGETYGASQRHGSVMSHIRVGEKELGPLIPLRQAHVVLGFEPIETLRVGTRYLNPESAVVMNIRPVYPIEALARTLEYPKIREITERIKKMAKNVWTLHAEDLAIKAGNAIAMNFVMVGALAGLGLTPFESNEYRNIIAEEIRKYKEINLKAFDLGLSEFR